MTVSDVGREGVRLVSQLTGVAISVPVVAGVRPARGCRARRSVAPRRRAQGARSQAESTGAAQGRVEKRGGSGPRLGYHDPHEGEDVVVYFGEAISSGYVLIPRAGLANVTSLEHERRKRAHPDFCRRTG